MQEREVSFPDKNGRKIVGTIILPEGDGPFPAVVVVHGFKGARNQRHIKEVAEAISAKGIVTLRVDLTNDPGESDLPFADMTPTLELEELEAVVDFIRNQKEVDPQRIGLTGHSLGGYLIMNYTAHHLDLVKSVAPLSAVFDFKAAAKRIWDKPYEEVMGDFKEKGWTYIWSRSFNKNVIIKETFYKDIFDHDAKDFAEEITCPVMILSGDRDSDVSLSHAERYYRGVSSKVKELKIIKNADHNYTKEGNLEEVVQAVSSWFAKTL